MGGGPHQRRLGGREGGFTLTPDRRYMLSRNRHYPRFVRWRRTTVPPDASPLRQELSQQGSLVVAIRNDLYSVEPRYRRSLATTALSPALLHAFYVCPASALTGWRRGRAAFLTFRRTLEGPQRHAPAHRRSGQTRGSMKPARGAADHRAVVGPRGRRPGRFPGCASFVERQAGKPPRTEWRGSGSAWCRPGGSESCCPTLHAGVGRS